MLKWSQDLYIGDEIFDRFETVRERLERGEPVVRAWLLTKPAIDRSEAVRMILLMTKACVERTNGADLRAFLETAPDIPEIHHIH